jgi:hypothetical protein
MMNEEQDFCARCLQLDDDCKCYELDHGDELCPHCEETWCDASCEDKEEEQDSDLCPVCQDFPIPEFNGCSCWYCPCGTTHPQHLLSCGGWGLVSRPDDIESVTRRLVAMANKMERVPATADWGYMATLREAADLLRTHAFPSDHPLMLD